MRGILTSEWTLCSLVHPSPWDSEESEKWIMSDSLRPDGLSPMSFLHPWDFPGKNTGVGCHFLLQEIFPTQGLNPGLPHCRQMLYCLSHQVSPKVCKERWICIHAVYSVVFPLFGTPLSMGFPRQEYWRGLPFPTPGDLPNPGIEPASPGSLALAGRFFTTAPPGKSYSIY